MNKYYYDYDPTLKRRVIHVLVKGWLISMVTGHRHRFKMKEKMIK